MTVQRRNIPNFSDCVAISADDICLKQYELPQGKLWMESEGDDHMAIVEGEHRLLEITGETARKILLLMHNDPSFFTPGDESAAPPNCRATARWILDADKSEDAKSGRSKGMKIPLNHAMKKFSHPFGVEWLSGFAGEMDIDHEGVVLGPTDADALIFHRISYHHLFHIGRYREIEEGLTRDRIDLIRKRHMNDYLLETRFHGNTVRKIPDLIENIQVDGASVGLSFDVGLRDRDPR